MSLEKVDMGDLSSNYTTTSIMLLPDDCLTIIFRALDSRTDRDSFCRTCRRWLHIHDFNRRSLQFECSFTVRIPTSILATSFDIHTSRLHRLLMRYQHLESLSLGGCTELKDSGLKRLVSYGSNLQKLNLDRCFKVTDCGLSLVASGCPSLTSISLYRCLRVTEKGFVTFVSACLSLKCVNISYCSQISDKGLEALIQHCRQLKAVNISECDRITGVGFSGCSKTLACVEAQSCKLTPEGVMGIVGGGGVEYLDVSCLSWSVLRDPLSGIRFSSRLKILNFRQCRTVSDTSVVAIAKGCPLLQEWNLASCNEVRISGWQAVGLYCQNLKRLHVNGCHNFSDGGLLALQGGCRRLSILYLSSSDVTSIALELFKSDRPDVCIKEEVVRCIKPNWAFR